MRLRIFISTVIGAASGTLCWSVLVFFHQDAADFRWAIRAAQDLLAHRNPYAKFQLYPLTAALFGLPVVWVPPEIAAGTFYGISSALLAFGLSRNGYHHLLIFLAYPYWAGILTAQWLAGAFFPLLLPVTLAKPQIGLPVALAHLSRRGVLACVVIMLLSLIVMPRWPLLWLAQIRLYDHFIPLLVLPGPLLAAALLRYRDRDALFLTMMALMPQRWFYDTLVLWLIPKSRKQILATVGLSWGAGIWRWYHVLHSWPEGGRWTVVFIDLPMLGVVLKRYCGEAMSNHMLPARSSANSKPNVEFPTGLRARRNDPGTVLQDSWSEHCPTQYTLRCTPTVDDVCSNPVLWQKPRL